jgi:hypothetical protein
MIGYTLNADGTEGPSLSKNGLPDRVQVVLKGGKYMPGLVEGLIGTRVGQTISLTVTFPNVRFFCVWISLMLYLSIFCIEGSLTLCLLRCIVYCSRCQDHRKRTLGWSKS